MTSTSLLSALPDLMFVQRGTQKEQNLFIKSCVCSYMFKLQSPSEYFPFDVIHQSRRFLYCSKQFLNSSVLIPFVLLLFLVLFLPHRQNVFLWGHFSSRETKKVAQGEIRWIRRVRYGVGMVMPFLFKNCWTLSMVWAGALVNHPS